MLEHLYVDSVDLTTFGAYLFDQRTLDAPEKEYTFYDVPSRDGSLVGLNKRMKNIDVEYYFVINSNVETNLKNLRSFLLSRDGYVRIEDSGHSGEFRMGVYRGKMQVKATRNRDMVRGVIVFNCQPQRWLTDGETPITKTKTNSASQSQSYTLNNPTHFHSKPLIRITGDGEVRIAGRSITILTTLTHSYVDIDCDSMACYCGNLNCSPDVIIRYSSEATGYGADPPTLPPGNWGITFPAYTNVTEVTVTPRYWEA